jgi:hypothetical protein
MATKRKRDKLPPVIKVPVARSFPAQLGSALIGERLYDLKHHLNAAQEILGALVGEHNAQANRRMKR